MTAQKTLKSSLRYAGLLCKWAFLGLLVGLLGGLLGAGFHHALHFVTELRGANPWLLFLLPVGGLATVGIYRLTGLRQNRGTNEIIEAAIEGKPVSPFVAPVIFLTTALTHLLGGSAGREGAALQMGGTAGSLMGKCFRMGHEECRLLTLCGMSAVFAGLFGTPLTACLFTVEFGAVGTIFSPALLPSFLAAFTASQLALLLGVYPEGLPIETAAALGLESLCQYAVLAVLVALLGIAMCHVFHKAEHLAQNGLLNPWLRIAIGGAVIIGLTLLMGNQRYNGAGMDMAMKALEGKADWYDFLLKLLFTAVTLAAGFKGGEIVPTFCIGATFGCVAGGLLGLDPGLAAALGLLGLFCSVTNSPLASIMLGIEMFGGANLHLYALVCVIAFVVSGRSSLYASQVLQFPKLTGLEK